MKGIMRQSSYRIMGAVVGLAALSMIFTFAPNLSAQDKGGPQDGPTPRTADGHPDLTGRYLFVGVNPPKEKPSFKPETKVQYTVQPPYGTCSPIGTPTAITLQTTLHGPVELLLKPGVLWVLTVLPQSVRRVPTDGRPHTKDPDTSAAGESVGHWDGDTLVVDTIGIDTRMMNLSVGPLAWSHSEAEHVIERFSRPSKDSLTYQLTFEDPMVLTKPFTLAPMHWSLAQGDGNWKEGVPHPGCDF